ncbi:F-box only protein 36 isoform X2 [Myotis myotis]|uniref:F-box only protein 36 isoform X2 n=1 Tax=Myotis myotis TaxID=51298 RepID=UPI00174E46F3|nr:F-box only protein 36 isoform X2 [Myotis myotis]
MASWLPEILFEIVGQGKAPSKDYYQMLITRSQVIFRWWKISLRSGYQSTKPGEVKESHEDFRENSHLQIQIALVFGARILDYVFNLCEGRIDFLERLSDDLLMRIISYLGIEDIASLSLTSHRFSKIFVHLPLSSSRKFLDAGAMPGTSSCTCSVSSHVSQATGRG